MIGTKGFKPNVQGANQVELSMLVFLELRGDLWEQLARARAANGAIHSDDGDKVIHVCVRGGLW